MLVIGVTGGIATGKSTTARFLSEYGAIIIDADEISREIVYPHSKVWQRIISQFGRDILCEDESINRAKLAEIVFSDPAKLKILNEITHSAVIDVIKQRLKELESGAQKAVVIDVPLLIEADMQSLVDVLVVVIAKEDTQRERLRDRGLNPDEATKRIRAQMSLSKKVELADYVIENDGTLEDLKNRVEILWENLKTNIPVGTDL